MLSLKDTGLAVVSSQSEDPEVVGMRVLAARFPDGTPVFKIFTTGDPQSLSETLVAIDQLGDKDGQHMENREIIPESNIARAREMEKGYDIINMTVQIENNTRQIHKTRDLGNVIREKKRQMLADVPIPPHQSLYQHQLMRALMGTGYDSEIASMSGNSMTTSAFSRVGLVKFLETSADIPHAMINPKLHKILIIYDPACGGSTSETAWISAMFIGKQMLILGGDSRSEPDPEVHCRYLIQHILKFNQIESLANVPVEIIVESNTAGAPWMVRSTMERLLKQDPLTKLCRRVYFYEDEKLRKLGFWTDETKKKEMQGWTGIKINDIPQAMLFYKYFITHQDEHPDEMKRKIYRQLLTYMRKFVPGGSGKKDKEFFSGKPFNKDDLAMCVQIGIYAHEMQTSPFTARRA